MQNIHAEDLSALVQTLEKIDPFHRGKFIDTSQVLRSVPSGKEIWLNWAAPLCLPDEITQLFDAMPPPPCRDPIATLKAIAKRRGNT